MCTFNTFKKDSKQKIKLNVEKLKSIIFDFDDVENSKKDLKILMKCFPNYFYILNTSDLKYQICYKFENDASIDFDEFEKIHFTLSNYFKSDKNISIPSLRLKDTTSSKYRLMVDGMAGQVFKNVV